MDFTAFPKVELHLHLDCSISYSLAKRLQPSLRRAQYENAFIAPAKCRDLTDFLARAQNGIRLLQSREALRWVTLDLLEQLRADGLIYAEIRFAPLLHTQRELSAEAVMDTVTQAFQEGQQATGLCGGLILCTLRKFSREQGLQTVELAQRYRDRGVVGFDIAGDEASFALSPHKPAFAQAQAYALPATAHAGEAKGPASVRESIESLSVRRIGHGVRSVEDEAALQLLKDRNIHLEICPTSNIQTDVYEDLSVHPVDQLLRAGVSIGINTDGRSLVGVTLSEEYQKLRQAFGWGKEEFQRCNAYALEAAFAPQETKAALRAKLERGWR